MQDPALVARLCGAMADASKGNAAVTVKCRIGVLDHGEFMASLATASSPLSSAAGGGCGGGGGKGKALLEALQNSDEEKDYESLARWS